MNEKKYYICPVCGNIVEVVSASGVNVKCCGKNMEEILPGVVEASHEKHIPIVKIDGDRAIVDVGSVTHPMSEEHSILWIAFETEKGVQRKYLKPGEEPKAEFVLANDRPVAVYAYCNLHGLWKSEI